MEELKNKFSFQVDSEIVKEALINEDNYLIEYTPTDDSNVCILYFSSNDLYYPNNEVAFKEQLIQKRKFEWYKTRIKRGSKHIFIRDIQKQWYLKGINNKINSPEKLLDFLKLETKGYQVIALGSSAGGYAAIIFGQLLKADMIFSFNGQFEVNSLLDTSEEIINPIIFRNKENNTLRKWYDTRYFIENPSTIYYFQSIKSKWDIEQYDYIKDISINRFAFITSNHGIPFLKTNLPYVINLSKVDLLKIRSKNMHPLMFSLKYVGLIQTMLAIISIIKFILKKMYIHIFLRAKK